MRVRASSLACTLVAALSGGCVPSFDDGPTLLCPSSFDDDLVVVPVGEELILEPDRALRFPIDWSWSIDFTPPGSEAALPTSYFIRAPFTPDVPGFYQLSLIGQRDEREATCAFRAVDRATANLDLESGTRSLDEVKLAGGNLELVLAVNEPVFVRSLEVRAGTPRALLGEPRVFRRGEALVIQVALAEDTRDDELFGLEAELIGLVTGTDVVVDEAVRLEAPAPVGPILHEARCAWDNFGRAVVLVQSGGVDPSAVDVGGFTLGAHALELEASVDDELLYVFRTAVSRGAHEGVVRARTDDATGPPLRFTCALE